MNTNILTSLHEELEEKKNFLLELTTRIQTNINKKSKELIKTVNTMNKVVSEIEQLEKEIKFQYYKDEIKEFWVSHWDYISLHDAILEAREAGYTDFRINELKDIYNEIEEYQD